MLCFVLEFSGNFLITPINFNLVKTILKNGECRYYIVSIRTNYVVFVENI
jgi:hypothetical protein